MTTPVLTLEGYGIAFGERVIHASIDLAIADRSVTVVVGPSGVGKSTLVRTLCGANAGNPTLRVWGRAVFAPAPRGTPETALVGQNARLLIGTVREHCVSAIPSRASLTPRELSIRVDEHLDDTGLAELRSALETRVLDLPRGLQRRLAIARAAIAGPQLLCADEPTSDVSSDEASAILALLRRVAERRGVLFVTHNQAHARAAGGDTALLAGGIVHEHAPTETFFAQPLTRAAQQFTRTGSCDVPSPGASPEDLAEGVVATPIPPEARTFVSDRFGPRGFRWLKQGALGGTPRPGIIDDLEHDLAALRSVGTTVLVTLEQEPPPIEALTRAGIRSLHVPIEDMRAPSIEAARRHCTQVAALVAAGEVVVVHCRAGLGRTGMMLAAQLVHEGASAIEALESARRIEPRWVQSDEQVAFLERFAAARPPHAP